MLDRRCVDLLHTDPIRLGRLCGVPIALFAFERVDQAIPACEGESPINRCFNLAQVARRSRITIHNIENLRVGHLTLPSIWAAQLLF
jgi:hypothetical protein